MGDCEVTTPGDSAGDCAVTTPGDSAGDVPDGN